MIEFNNDSIGKTIRRLRLEKGQSQEFLSSWAGIARSHLSMIETGTKQANFETLWKIANALDMKPSDFVREIEDDLKKSAAK